MCQIPKCIPARPLGLPLCPQNNQEKSFISDLLAACSLILQGLENGTTSLVLCVPKSARHMAGCPLPGRKVVVEGVNGRDQG